MYFLVSNIVLSLLMLIVIFSLVLIFRQFGEVYLSTGASIARDGLPIGTKLPEFNALNYKNGNIIFSQEIYNSPKPTLVAFVTPNCPACKDLLKDINKMVNKYNGRLNFVLFGIGYQPLQFDKIFKDVPSDVKLFVEDLEKPVFKNLNLRVTPFAFLLDQEGIIQEKGLCNTIDHVDSFYKSYESSKSTKINQKGVKVSV
ncbi:thioredoxin-like domain-containing protein [Fictibacillus sp. NPDC058756]|uniref:thioredoxin-like domain-containing protein n=1 Tax=Fictibacillus sp. NPDC058756 TaxID=3346625 RepID=UPI00369312A7